MINESVALEHRTYDRRKPEAPRRHNSRNSSFISACGNVFPLELIIFVLLSLSACSHPLQTAQAGPGEWREFHGTWTAAGTRNIMRLNGDRHASIATLEGSLVLAGPVRPGVGFRSEIILFNDTTTGLLGRAVWTDEHGDQAFSELRGQGNSQNNTIEGTFIGGTGRYAGITGTYSFSWKFLIENEEGGVQGQSIGLYGRVRLCSPEGVSGTGGPKA
jgi:hypothetical protein